MKVGRFDLKIFVEGIEINTFNNFTLYINETTSPTLQIVFPTVKNARKLLPGTLIQLFIRDTADPEDSDKWFIFFEGSLEKKNFYKTDSSNSLTLIFNGISSIFEKTSHSRYDLGDEISGVASDVLLGNYGINSKAEATIPFRNPTGGTTSTNFLSLSEWNKWMDKGGFASFAEALFKGIPLNTPYFKIIDDSLRVIDRVKFYKNELMFKLAKQVNAFREMNEGIIKENSTQTYKVLLNRILGLGLAKILELGIPCKDDEGKIRGSLVIPSNDFVVPPIFNVIYPDEFDNYQINLNSTAEPTRAMNSSLSTKFMAPLGVTGPEMVPTFLAPTKQLLLDPVKSEKTGKISYYLKFTEEEKWRGVSPVELQSTPYQTAYATLNQGTSLDHLILDKDTLIAEAKKRGYEKHPEYFDRMLFITDWLYFQARLASRGIGQITVPYFNPNWLIGFPGVIVTDEHGPILVNFHSYTITVAADGKCESVITVDRPRFLDDYLPVDSDVPRWYEDYYSSDKIGKLLYNSFAKHALDKFPNGTSIVDVTKTSGSRTPIKDAMELISKSDRIPFEDRKRNFIAHHEYFKFLETPVDPNTGFPNPKFTLYREASKLDALRIAKDAEAGNGARLDYLKCPYVLERGKKVVEWLELGIELLKDPTIVPPPAELSKEDADKMEARSMNIDETRKETGWKGKLKSVTTIAPDALREEVCNLYQDNVIDYESVKYRVNIGRELGPTQINVDGYKDHAKDNLYDLYDGKAVAQGGKGWTLLSTNIYNMLKALHTQFDHKVRLVRIIRAHSATQVNGSLSPHACGRAIDIVGFNKDGLPSVDETNFIYKWLMQHAAEFKIRRILWFPNGEDKDHSPGGQYGMHMHVNVTE